MTPTIEADQITRTAEDIEEVARLVAMLEGEPACGLSDAFGQNAEIVLECKRPARWIARHHCGHPFVVCDHHHFVISHQTIGMITCVCGRGTIFSADPLVRLVATPFGTVPITGPPVRFLPL